MLDRLNLPKGEGARRADEGLNHFEQPCNILNTALELTFLLGNPLKGAGVPAGRMRDFFLAGILIPFSKLNLSRPSSWEKPRGDRCASRANERMFDALNLPPREG